LVQRNKWANQTNAKICPVSLPGGVWYMNKR
jgi:hypothetical protein